MNNIINLYDNFLESAFGKESANHVFDLKKELPLIVEQYERFVKPDFLYVMNMRAGTNRIVFEKNYNLKSNDGKITFESIMEAIPSKQFQELMDIDVASAHFINDLFEEPFQFLMNVSFPIELIKGKPQYFLRTATVMSFDKDGVADYAIGFLRNLTPITGQKKGLKFYISSDDDSNVKLQELVVKFNELLQSKLMLTSQEKNILLNVKEGKTSVEIADLMNIAKSTVDTHRQNIIKKLKVKNVREAIQKSIDLCILD